MFDTSDRARNIRIIALALAVFLAMKFFADQDVGKALALAIIVAFLSWFYAIETEVIKAKLKWHISKLTWKKKIVAEADILLFDLMALRKDAESLAFRPAGETEEQWAARAAECWKGSWDQMHKVRRRLWSIRTFLKDYENLDNEVQELSGLLRTIITITQEIMAKTGVYKIKELLEKMDEIKGVAGKLDGRFRNESKQMFEKFSTE